MKLFFGLDLDSPRYPAPHQSTCGHFYLSPYTLLKTLENYLGLSGYEDNNEYLRIEVCRQTIQDLLTEVPGLFFAHSFHADPFATAKDILQRRDELLLHGWAFQITDPMPARLRDLATLEQAFRAHGKLLYGYADRYQQVIRQLKERKSILPFTEIIICEEASLLPYRDEFLLRQVQGACMEQCSWHVQSVSPQAEPVSDLSQWQSFLYETKGKKAGHALRGDGSLLLLRAPSSNEAASFLAKLFVGHPNYRPVCYLADQARQLDQACVQEGLPSLGLQSNSSARPSLQLLKLTPAFLWDPIDPYKVIQFVSLAIKPIDQDLGKVIGGLMARSPGIQSDRWNRAIAQFFQRLEDQHFSPKKIQSIQSQYRFWFTRKRYSVDQLAPKGEAINLFATLQTWAYEMAGSDSSNNNKTLYVLAEQAKRVREILESLPETEISNLQLEQIVRTIYEPAPVQIRAEEKNRFDYVLKPGALLAPMQDLIWWNFTSGEPDYFFSRWYQPEWSYLHDLGVRLETPARDNQRVLKRRMIPMLQCQKQLILVIPEQVHGVSSNAHPLYGDLQACFSNLDSITFHTKGTEAIPLLGQPVPSPAWEALAPIPLPTTTPFLGIPKPEKLKGRTQETFTSLQSLFYYPYQWLFKHQLKLRPSSILSVVKDQTLMGNLAHRLFEKLLSEPGLAEKNREDVRVWVAEHLVQLLKEEGSVLLLYGREPERIHFRNTLQWAAWALVEQIQNNHWEVHQSEMPLEGTFSGTSIKGIADLVLRRGNEQMIIDLKWRGASYREREIKNEEDLQLNLYAHLLAQPGEALPHTAYFIISKARILARNNLAFEEITGLNPDLDAQEIAQRILERMELTWKWRAQQIAKGVVEIRCSETLQALESHYAEADDDLLDLLEMRNQDAPFDDYRTLIGLVQ